MQKINNDYDIRPLAAAIVLQAVSEAKQGDRSARQWLQGEGLAFMDVCGVTLERDQVRRWMQKGYKVPSRGGRRLGR